MGRKYEKYSIKVTFLDNSIEEIQYQGVNTSSYKEMLKLYCDIKKQYKDNARKIDFVGIGEDGQLQVMFTKPIVIENKPTLIDELKDVLIKIENRKTQLSDILSILDKEINSTNHDIENIPYKCVRYSKEDLINYKVELVDKILKASFDRRQIKKEHLALENTISQITTKNIKLNINKANILLHKEFDLENKKDTTTVYSMRYTNDTDRNEKINELSNKYQKVVDMGNGIIKYCNCVYKSSAKKNNNKTSIVEIQKDENDLLEISSKIPKIKGSTIKIKFKSAQQKQHLINKVSKAYHKYEINEEEKYIELIDKKCGS